MVWDSDFLKIDGVTYQVPVKTDISRTFNVLDKYAKRVQSGDMKRKIIGVYKNYTMSFYKQDDSNYNDYEALIDKLTEPIEFHLVKIGNYSFKCYITSVSDKLYEYKDGKEYYKDLTVEYVAEKAWRTP